MISVHTYLVKIFGEDDYCQFMEYSPNKKMRVIISPDIPIAFLFPSNQSMRSYLRNTVKHYYGDECHVSFYGTEMFDEEYLDLK